MNINSKVNIWLNDGSVLKKWVLLSAEIKVSDLPYDVNMLQKLDDAYLYDSDGSQISRELVSGSLKVHGLGINQPLNLDLEKIKEMLAASGD